MPIILGLYISSLKNFRGEEIDLVNTCFFLAQQKIFILPFNIWMKCDTHQNLINSFYKV
jgi:hypothetical protein